MYRDEVLSKCKFERRGENVAVLETRVLLRLIR